MSNLTGVAVTPVIGYVGDIEKLNVTPNIEEVGEWFTVPIEALLHKNNWTKRELSAPVFNGGPHPIWGLTGYLLHRFLEDVVLKFSIKGHENTQEFFDSTIDCDEI